MGITIDTTTGVTTTHADDSARGLVDYAAMVERLMQASRFYRERLFSVEGEEAASCQNAIQYIELYGVGVHGPRRSGKSFYATGQLDRETILVTSNLTWKAHAQEMAVAHHPERFMNTRDPILQEQIVTVRELYDANIANPANTVYRRCRRIIVGGAGHVILQNIADRVRDYPRRPELIFIYY